jgi:hypothetical protein
MGFVDGGEAERLGIVGEAFEEEAADVTGIDAEADETEGLAGHKVPAE